MNRTFWFLTFIVFVGLVHRYMLFSQLEPDLLRLIDLNPSWLTMQYLGVDVLREQLGLSLLYLQQNPPIPQLIMGIVLKISDWPVSSAAMLIGIQFVISVASAVCLFLILSLLSVNRYIGLLMSVIYMLSIDVIVMEYTALGQLIYENIAMLFLLLSCWVFLLYQKTGLIRYAVLLGLLAAALALSRASFSYFFIVPLLCLVSMRGDYRDGKRSILMFLFPVFILQGGWMVKNYCIYQTATLSTSSWQGSNFVKGVVARGHGKEFKAMILENPDNYPKWFVTMNEEKGLSYWWGYKNYIPENIVLEDDLITGQFKGSYPATNSISQRLVSEWYMKAYVDFARYKPLIIISELFESYRLYWTPIRNYSREFLSLIYVDSIAGGGFSPIKLLKSSLNSLPLNNTYILRSKHRAFSDKLPVDTTPVLSVNIFSVSFIPLLMIVVNFFIFHIAILACGFFLCKSIFYGGEKKISGGLSYMIFCCCYLGVVSSLAEYGENNRFRLVVEPVLWVISIYTIHLCCGFFMEIKHSYKR